MALPTWHFHPDVWLLLLALEGGYLAAIARRRRKAAPGEEVATRRKVVLFTAGVAVLWIGADWPVHDLAERFLYSVHMVQHMLFSLVAPPLLIAGMPAWMLRRMLEPRPIAAAAGFLTRPLVAMLVFNGALLFTHWPAVVQASVGSEPIHFALHALVFGSALVMWWPVMSPLPELPALPAPGQMLYLFFQSLAPTIPAAVLTFGHSPLYPVYQTFPRIWGIGALTDQLVDGLIMKLGGGLILWGVIATVFFRWFGQERRDGWDSLKFWSAEREIRAELKRG